MLFVNKAILIQSDGENGKWRGSASPLSLAGVCAGCRWSPLWSADAPGLAPDAL